MENCLRCICCDNDNQKVFLSSELNEILQLLIFPANSLEFVLQQVRLGNQTEYPCIFQIETNCHCGES